jgi:hypothetical protein
MFSLAHEFSEGDDGIGNEFRMLDDLRGLAGNSRDQNFPGGEFHVAPDFEFMFVTDVAGFDPQPQFLSLDS